MSISVSDLENEECLVSIKDEMTIYTVLEQRDKLQPYLKPGKVTNIDLRAVSEIDSAGIQLLIYLKKVASEVGAEMKLQNHSQAVFEVFDLTEFFADAVVISMEWELS
ncbi:MAG: STAS domain-containing protein [Psychromonas sp.]|nr:STAS domain-containing protein [Alteromonadales bacterium]MCP5076959.1 STAS domain-containing protein [Psychromonas sp.]